jgi:DNA (cytosine-5)-methyltransferase 1
MTPRPCLQSAARPSFKGVSLFTGAGGLDLGLEAAGFSTCVAVDIDDDCARTLAANRDWPLLARSIHAVASAQLMDIAALAPGETDLLFGGPPCQPFSKAGYWASGDSRRLDDPRADTLGAFLRVLRDLRPRAFLIENVAGLAYRGKDEGLRLVQHVLDAINREAGTGYHADLLVLNAADFGVPQLRQRAFLVGARDGTRIGPLIPTHGEPATGEQLDLLGPARLQTYLTAWDAIGDLEDDDDPQLAMRGKWADLLPSIPEGSNYLHFTDRGDGPALFGWRRRFWNFLLKLAKAQPSWTLTAQPGPATGPFHWCNRRLSARELCRLQTIPDDYRISGNLAAVQRQVGNAVPSALAEFIGLAIRHRLLGDRRAAHLTPTLLPQRRAPIPPSACPAPVPEKYLHLAGSHSPHPGTGQGYAAIARTKRSGA